MLQKIKKIFGSYDPEELPEDTIAWDAAMTDRQGDDHAFDLQERIIEQTVKALRPLRGIAGLKQLTLFTSDPYCLAVMQEKSFVQTLALAFDNAGMEQFGSKKIEVADAVPADTSSLIPVMEGKVKVSLNSKADSETATVLILRALDKTDALEQPEYVLDGSKKTVFHIGRGHRGSRNTLRFNDIVVDGSLTTVSSEQADILYRNGHFYLQANPGGCRATGGSSTILQRDGQAKELYDTHSMTLLRSGDWIEMGKAVVLEVIRNQAESSA